jgi:6-phosphogluconate dehydrogenase
MRIGMIGLGRMGYAMARRMMQSDHECVAYDVNTDIVAKLHGDGAMGAVSIEHFISLLTKPRVIWLMLPAAAVDQVLAKLTSLLEAGDVIVDGGNSYYRDDIRRAATLKAGGIHYVDVGTSGGVYGFERGYCLMIGGEKAIVQQLDPVFAALAPGDVPAPQRPDSSSSHSTAEKGYLHCGTHGAGHFVKMVHNGIEYGLMAAYAEGFNILHKAGIGAGACHADAETAPLHHPEYYQYTFRLPEIAEVWRRGSVIASWLLDLTAGALRDDPELNEYEGRVSDSGEGRWTVLAAVEEGVPAPVISAALFGRFASRRESEFADRILSAMRKQFGGHDEKQGARPDAD